MKPPAIAFLRAPLAFTLAAVAAATPSPARAQTAAPAAATANLSGPPRNPQFFPLDQLHRGMTALAWTVFEGAQPEPMQVEILGVLRGARGPGQDLILARLRGDKPEYTGVVAGMSGSPVYIDGKLLGALSYRIGTFTKEPLAGITPIEQMIEVRDFSSSEPLRAQAAANIAPAAPPAIDASGPSPLQTRDSIYDDSAGLSQSAAPELRQADARDGWEAASGGITIQPMETPLVLSGFSPQAVRFWREQTAGTPLAAIAAGGMSSTSGPASPSPDPATLEPGSSVSMQLVRGDIEIAATCTVTWIDPSQLLACGHPVLGAGPVSLPMTATDIVATVASPLNAFKIVNTGRNIGAFTDDRESAIHGVFGAQARMIPIHIAVSAPGGSRDFRVEILDLPSLTPLALMVTLLDTLTETNQSSEDLSYHLTGRVDLAGYPALPLDLWAPAASGASTSLAAVILTGQQFTRLYSNASRQGLIRQVDLHVEALPRPALVLLEQARFVSSDIAHAGDTIQIQATLRPWQQAVRNVRIAFPLPARLAPGNLRLLISDAATLDRALSPSRLNAPPPDLAAVLAQARNQHAADKIYVTILTPDTQGDVAGQTLTALPLSIANSLESMRNAQNATLSGESASLAAEAPAGGVLSGFQVLNLHIEGGGGLN